MRHLPRSTMQDSVVICHTLSERDSRVMERPARVGTARSDVGCVGDDLPGSAGNAGSSERVGGDDCACSDGHGRGCGIYDGRLDRSRGQGEGDESGQQGELHGWKTLEEA